MLSQRVRAVSPSPTPGRVVVLITLSIAMANNMATTIALPHLITKGRIDATRSRIRFHGSTNSLSKCSSKPTQCTKPGCENDPSSQAAYVVRTICAKVDYTGGVLFPLDREISM